MTKQQFQALCTVVITLVVLPLSWFVVYKLPLTQRVWWSIGLLLLAVLFKKFIYEPLAKRFPD